MSPETNVSRDATDLIIASKELWQATYMALSLFVTVGLAVMIFQDDLQLLGDQLAVASLALAALILIVTNMNLIRMASRRTDFKAAQLYLAASMAVQSGELVAQMMDSHLRLDEAIGTQLKGVVSETENAAMMLIIKVRNVSDAANTLVSNFNNNNIYEDMLQHDKALLDVVSQYNARLAVDVAEIFGQIQFQDTVRQRIERVESAMAQRSVLFHVFAQGVDAPDANLLELPVKMREVLDEYLSIESLHAPAFNNAAAQDVSIAKIELF